MAEEEGRGNEWLLALLLLGAQGLHRWLVRKTGPKYAGMIRASQGSPWGILFGPGALGLRLEFVPLAGRTYRRVAVSQATEAVRRVAAWEEPFEVWGDWSRTLQDQLDRWLVWGAALGLNGWERVEPSGISGELAGHRLDAQTRLNGLAGSAARGERSPAQVAAWAAALGAGLTRTSFFLAANAAHDEGVVRVLGAAERHCPTCPSKQGAYPSAAAMVAACGGWPGDGSDRCGGQCRCGVYPRSVYPWLAAQAGAVVSPFLGLANLPT